MKEVIKKEILFDLDKIIKILEKREKGDIEELRILSDHGIDDVALYKDVDLISITVLAYSLYKNIDCLSDEDYKDLLVELKSARDSLKQRQLGRYNKNVRTLFAIVRKCTTKVREHLQDVMQAAKIKKGSLLLNKGLSIGQAAGLMGLSNWDLQNYASNTASLDVHTESKPAKGRVKNAFKIFGI
jgi:hypothetical protein